jgi:hypothetical protein
VFLYSFLLLYKNMKTNMAPLNSVRFRSVFIPTPCNQFLLCTSCNQFLLRTSPCRIGSTFFPIIATDVQQSSSSYVICTVK